MSNADRAQKPVLRIPAHVLRKYPLPASSHLSTPSAHPTHAPTAPKPFALRPRPGHVQVPAKHKAPQSLPRLPFSAKPRVPLPLRPIEDISQQRSRSRLYRIDIPILAIEGVALLLATSVPFVRSIPPSLLPRRRIGKRFLYRQDDVIKYVCGLSFPIREQPIADELVRDASSRLIQSASGSRRGPRKGEKDA